MAKRLNVDLVMKADTSQASQALKALTTQLAQIQTSLSTGLNMGGLNQDIGKAVSQVAELQTHLKNATNINTGKLDFAKLSTSLKASNKTLGDYAVTLRDLGPAGQQAFMQLSQAVAQSEVPLRRTNGLLHEFSNTLKNTARWQISSSILHGFMGSLQTAYGYAKNLNESLNNIRIVTGNSKEQMAEFAKQANAAAKALSTTTTNYTDAALIYFQQGLVGDEVTERTDATVKMANVTGETAEQVSQQMTAIWNNFDDGSKSLEYYADVITALGAATASSTDEISEGLEKFAAVADTVGLSYEYATSALATVTATTRQSADVVGTAFKTLFARIDSLKQGDTLDDGVTLGKYSEALDKIGVNVLDATGQLRDMDSILSDMGAKWQTLSDAQKVATAQTVAGVRQYTQLIALMDNWDFMQENLNTAYNSEGELQKQADIYAESWEAARDRVRAAAETIYSDLINDEFFIDILNNIEDILTGVDKFIKSIGGLKGVLTTTSALLMNMFSKQLADSIRNMTTNIMMATDSGRNYIKQQKINDLNDINNAMNGDIPINTKVQAQIQEQNRLQIELESQQDKMDDRHIAKAQQLLDVYRQIGDQIIANAQIEDEAKDKKYDAKTKILAKGRLGDHESGAVYTDKEATSAINSALTDIERYESGIEKVRYVQQQFNEATGFTDNQLDILKQAFEELGYSLDDQIESFQKLGIELDENKNVIQQFGAETNSVKDELADMTMNGLVKSIDAQEELHEVYNVAKKDVQDYVDNTHKATRAILEMKDAEQRGISVKQQFNLTLKEAKSNLTDFAGGIVSSAQAIMSIVSVINIAKGALDTLNNPNASGWEKFTSVLSSAAMTVIMLSQVINSLAEARKKFQGVQLAASAATVMETIATTLETKAEEAANREKERGILLSRQKAQALHAEAAAELEDAGATTVDAIAEGGENVAKGTGEVVSLGSAFKHLISALVTFISKWSFLLKGLGAFTVAIGVVIGVTHLLTQKYNEASLAAEKAAQKEIDAANAASEATEVYNNLKNTIDSYQNARDNIDSLVEGTVEFKNAILEANDSAIKLLETYDDLTPHINANGLIEIDPEELAQAQTKALEDQTRAQNNYLEAKIRTTKAEEKANRVEFERSKLQSNADHATQFNDYMVPASLGGGIAGMLSTAALGAVTGTALGPVGTAIGAAAGLIVGAFTAAAETENKLNSTIEDEAINTIKEASKDEKTRAKLEAEAKDDPEAFKASLRELGITDEKLIDSLAENDDAIFELIDAENANTEALREYYKSRFNEKFADDERIKNSEDPELLQERYAKILEDQDSDLYKEATKYIEGLNRDQLWDEYLKAQFGAENASQYRVTDKPGDNATIEKYNEETGGWDNINKEKNAVNIDDVKTRVTEDYILEHLDSTLTQWSDEINQWGQQLKDSGLSGTENQDLRHQIMSDFENNNEIDLMGLSPKDVHSIDLSQFSGELAKAMSAAVENFDKQYKENNFKETGDYIFQTEDERQQAEQTEKAEIINESGISNDEFDEYVENLAEINNLTEENIDLAEDMAKKYLQTSNGLAKLNKVYDEYAEDLESCDHANINYVKGIDAMRSSLEDMLGVQLDNSVIEELNDNGTLKRALEGDVDAIDALYEAAAQQIVIDADLNDEGLETDLLNKITELSNEDIEIGATLDDTEFVNTLNEMLQAGEMTADEVNAILANIGYDPVIDYEEITVKDYKEGKYTGSAFIAGANGAREEISSEKVLTMNDTDTIMIPRVNGSKTKFTGSHKAAKAPKRSSGGGGGGGRRGGNKADKKDAKDEKDRYHEIKEIISDVERVTQRLNKEKDKLFGKSRLQKMDEEIAKTKELINYNEQYLKQVQSNIDVDQKALNAAAGGYGLTVQYDGEGRVTNYNALIEAAVNKFNNSSRGDGDEEKYEKFKKALEKYEETLNLAEEVGEKIKDLNDEILSKNYEKITYEIEIRVQLNENDMKAAEYAFKKMRSNIYTTAEALVFLEDQIKSGQEALNIYGIELDELKAKYAAGEISDADYAAGLQDVYNNIYNNVEALDSLDETMRHYYGETLSLATDELRRYTDQLDHLAGVAEHYQKILELTNNKKDFELTNKIYDTRNTIAKNAYKASKEWYDSLKNQGADIIANWQSVQYNPKDSHYDIYKQEYDDYMAALRDAENEMLDDLETVAETARDILSNNLDEAAYNLEKSLSGTFGTFDALNDAMENMQSYTEDYLTDTNKIYETNKLLNDIAIKSSKTDNQSAKQRYAAFANDIKQLQEKDQLSNLELEIAQAKYDLLEKQIALEEAQKAKNTVRLSRDDEGNYGYVYTANSEEITNAEQALQDAENDLYNIMLDATNNYGQKRLQAQQQLANELIDIDKAYQEGAYESEEAWQNARAQVIDRYTRLIVSYGNLYGIAQQEDSRVVQEAWVNSFDEISKSGDEWVDTIYDYCDTTTEAFKTWEDSTHEVVTATAQDFDDLTESADTLANNIIDYVVPTLEEELVNALTSVQDYIDTQRDHVLSLKNAYIDEANAVKDLIVQLANLEKKQASVTKKASSGSGATTTARNSSSSNSGSGSRSQGSGGSADNSRAGRSPSYNLVSSVPTATKLGITSESAYKTYLKKYAQQHFGAPSRGFTVTARKFNGFGNTTYSFDTGGYTGKWGKDGKWALLHEKELVLNKQDTKNILASVQLMRELTKSIDTQAGWASMGLGILSSAKAGIGNNNLEQQVTISAEFPNATDHYEIEEAFKNLINEASQYANRR